ncbi:MAG: HEAT repeat domain-containing protein [Planctomycetes bacterium]|nr:HEAT repeat domain-containing protein [Planctomycetota bacterium]
MPPAAAGQTPPAGGERPTAADRPSQRLVRPIDPGEVTVAVFTGLLELLAAMARARPMVLVLDDLEYADEATLELVRRALPRGERCLFVGAARAGGHDERSPYAALRRSLAEHANAVVLELEPLDREGTAELTTQLLAGFRPPAPFVDRLHGLSRGNPLFVEGALRHLVETRALVRVEDGWRAEREVPANLPLTLDELIRNRLKVLDPELAELVASAAVVGPSFDFEVLRASTGKRAGEALELVSDAVKQKLLREEGPDGELEFASRAVQDASYEGLDEAERTAAHRRVGEALEAQGEDTSPAALAYHFGRAGDRQKRDRFAGQVRARRELVFDRDAVESLGDGRHPRIPEVTEPAPPSLVAALPGIAKALASASKVVRQYPASSKSVTDAVDHLVSVLEHALDIAPAFTVSHRGNALTLNGRPVDKAYGEGAAQEAVSGLYRVNSIKSLTFLGPRLPTLGRELLAFLAESASRSVQVPMERYFWSVFAADHDLRAVGIAQKTLTLQHQHGLEARVPVEGRVMEQDPAAVRLAVEQLAAALAAARAAPADAEPPEQPELDRALRAVFQHAPALALHEGEGEALVVNGSVLAASELPGAPEVLRALRETRLRGVVLLEAIPPQELSRFVGHLARLAPPRDALAARDAAQAINVDGSLPNVLAGDALLQLARDLLSPREAPAAAGDDAPPAEAPAGPREEASRPPQEEDEDMPPVTFRDADLPAQFEWPSDAVAQRAYALTKLPPAELLASPASGELAEVLEMVLLEGRPNLAFRVVDRVAVNFAGQDPADRRRAAELLQSVARRGSQELRASFFSVAVRRLGDAIELESDPEVFEKLAECARVGILERVAEGDWDLAARLVWALGRRRDKRNDAQTRLEKTGKRVLGEAIEDPRFQRVFDTIEAGSQQERRKAARILEGMGAVAVDRLLRALRETTRGRVETFLIDMLAALVPESEAALQKEVTPFTAPADAAGRLLRAAAVVCRDATHVLIAGLQNADPVIQAEAVGVARSLGGKAAQNVLRWAIQHGAPQAQLAAVQHLGELARPDAVDELLDLLQRTNIVEVQRECCLAFGKLSLVRAHHDKVVPALSNCLRPGGLLRTEFHEDVRAAAAFALGQMKGNEAARKALEKALEDRVPRVRRTAQLMLDGK